jgi:uncharacterized protein (TIGR03067 family)
MRAVLALALIAAIAVCAGHAGQPKATKKEGKSRSDLERLQGTWEPVKGDKEKMTMTFKGMKLVMAAGPLSIEGRFRLDPDARPRQIDLSIALGEKELTTQAIYEFDGDELKIGSGRDPEARPKDFASAKEVMRFRRVKEAP